MNIQQAAKLAHESGKSMFRQNMPAHIGIVPTNTPSCCIVDSIKTGARLYARWEPSLNDLIADDWEVHELLGNELAEEVGDAE